LPHERSPGANHDASQGFEHAVRLPVARQQSKAAAWQILRMTPAAFPNDLQHALQPLRAVVQLLGSLTIPDAGRLRLLLARYLTARDLPEHALDRRIRRSIATFVPRQDIDSTTTEAFAALRVVRPLPQRSESTALRLQPLHGRQQLHVCGGRIVEVIWRSSSHRLAALLLYAEHGARGFVAGRTDDVPGLPVMLLGPIAHWPTALRVSKQPAGSNACST